MTRRNSRRGRHIQTLFSVCLLMIFIAATPLVTVFGEAEAPETGTAGEPESTAETLELGPAALAGRPLYRLLPGGRFEQSAVGQSAWSPVDGLPVRVLPADRAGEPQPVTAIGIDQRDNRRLLAAVGSQLFLSTDACATWSEVDISGTINRSTYVTAIAMDPESNGRWLLGTSYDGLYLTEDGGLTWTDITAEWTIAPLYLGARFYDEIGTLQFESNGRVLVGIGMGGGFVSLDLEARAATRLRPLVDGARAYRAPLSAGQTPPIAGAPQGAVPNDAIAAAVPISTVANSAVLEGGEGSELRPSGESSGAARRRLAADRTGIYLAAPNATEDKLPDYLDYMERHGFDSIVIDLKDDYGRITYDTGLELPRAIGAVQVFVDVPTLVRLAHERDIYVIGRIVVFKDQRLYRYDTNRLALWDSVRDRPWGVFRTVTDEETGEERVVQVEHWVDPYAPEVWDYVGSIAEEVAGLGVDEIQFDYVRFPSDGNTASISSRFAPAGAGRVDALEAFLGAARARLSIPVGIDVFGFNAWSRMSYLGQDIARLGRYVDVISPMFYPSHFALSFLPDLSYMERSRVIYDEGTRRAREIAQSAGDRVLIRPYVQAFLIGRELEYEAPEYLHYLQVQLEGAATSDSDGYTLWNASGRYYMLP